MLFREQTIALLLALNIHTYLKTTDRVKSKSSVNCLDHMTFTERAQRSWSESKPDDLHLESPEMHELWEIYI